MGKGQSSQQVVLEGFPGGPVIKNLPSNAGDTGLIPGQETKIPHAVPTKAAGVLLFSRRRGDTKTSPVRS